MPIYEYEGQEYEISDQDPKVAKEKILKYLASQDEEFKVAPVPVAPGKAGFSPKDTALALGQGIVGAGKSLTDVFGADNAVSNYLGSISSGMGQAYTPARQAEMQERSRLQAEASKSGDVTKEIGAYLGAVAEAPVQSLAQILGSLGPYVATGVVGRVARLGGPAVRAINTVVGTAQGAGAVKGSIYDSVKDELVANGMGEKEAKDKASKAQEYLGSNILDIIGGAALGGAGARYGVENLLTPGMTAKLDAKLLPRVGKAMLAEAPLEGLQGGQEQLAINRALIDEGFKRDAMEGVFGATVRDAVMGAMGAGVVGMPGPGKKPIPKPEIKAGTTEEPPTPTPSAPATAATAPMFDEQGNVITSRQVTPEDIEAIKVAKAEEIKKDEAAMLGEVEFKTPVKEEGAVAPKFEALTPEAQKLVEIASIGAAPAEEMTPVKIKQIAETNGIDYIKADGLPLTFEELIGELNAKARTTERPADTTADRASTEVLSERGTVSAEGTGEPDRPAVVDAGSDVDTAKRGKRKQQPALAFDQWVANKGISLTDSTQDWAALESQWRSESAPQTKEVVKEEPKKEAPPAEEVAPTAENYINTPTYHGGVAPGDKETAMRFAAHEQVYDTFDKKDSVYEKGKQEADAQKREAFLATLTPQERKEVQNQAQLIEAQENIKREQRIKQTTGADKRKSREKRVLDDIIKLERAERKKALKALQKEEKAIEAEKAAEQKAVVAEETQVEKSAKKEAKETKAEKTKFVKSVERAITEGNVTTVLDMVGNNSEHMVGTMGRNFEKLLSATRYDTKARKNVKVFDVQTKIKFGDVAKGDGQFDPATNTITIKGNDKDGYTGKRPLAETVLHEVSHSTLDHVFDNPKEFIKALPEDRRTEAQAALNRLQNNYKVVKAKFGKKYKIDNIKEFAAEFWANPKLQMDLALMPSETTYAPKDSLFTTIVKNIANALGIGGPRDGVLFKQTAEDLAQLISVPTEEIVGKGISYLQSDVTGLKPTGPEKQHRKIEFNEYINNLNKNLDDKLPVPAPSKIKDLLTTSEGGNKIIRMFQNRRYPLRKIYIALERAGKLIATGKDINNTAAQFDTAAAIADDKDRQYNRQTRDAMIESIGNYAAAAGISEHDALTNLQVYFEVNHEPERRQVKYLTTVPLSHDKNLMYLGQQISPADRRRQILDFLNNYREDNETKRHDVVKALRKELDDIVANPANLDTSKKTMLDINDPRYNVIAGLSPEKIANFKEQLLAKPEVKNHLAAFEDISAKLQEINKNNIELNKQGNFWTQPVDNWATFYGFKNYVPFKGKPDTEVEDSQYDPSRKMLVGLQEAVDGFSGRESESDNPVIQTMIDSVNAARRAGYKDVTLSIKNSVNQGYLAGNTKEVIKFDSNRAENIKKQRGQNKVFHYEPNGDITVIELQNKEQREAIRNMYREDHPFVNVLDAVTGTIGQFHTRYNPAFAPVNFTGDLMTNIFTMGAEFGPATSGQLLKNIAAIVGTGGLYKAGKVAILYNKSGTKELRKYTDKNSPDYDPFYADLVEYLERGGKVSYMQAFDTQSNTSKTINTIKRGGKQTTKEQVDGVIDTWGNMFEFASRAASYKTAKEIYLKQNADRGMSKAEAEEDAKARATYYAKNLANFEQVGEYGKLFGAFYMFARPAATGAVRAIEALTPLMRAIGGERFDTTTPEGKALSEQAKSGAIMILALLGLGVASYTMATMMSDDDEEGRNRTATDDMDRWQKYMRFHIPKYLVGGRDDVILQMRWGYGLGSFASAGAQLAALATGNSSFKTAGTNILQSGLDSFLPLPISRINIFDNTAAWFLDTATPSAFRPFLEYTMNLDGLGREIYNNRQSRIGDAYTGGDNIPEMYKTAARTLFNITEGGVDVSPNTMYFFANNGADGLFRVAGGAYNLGLVAAGQKAFNPKTDTILFDSFFGSKSNFDARQFSEVEKQVKEIDKKIKTLEADPERLVKFMEDSPNAFAAVEFYNKAVNGDLRELRAEANRIRGDRTYTPKERKELLDNITQMSNLVKRNMLMNFQTLGYTP